MQLADAGAHLLQQMSDPRIVIVQHLEFLADFLMVVDRARFRASTYDGADGNDRQEHELQEIRPIEDLLLIARPHDRREPEDHESVKRPDRADEHGDPRRQDIIEARNKALLRDLLHRQTSRQAAPSHRTLPELFDSRGLKVRWATRREFKQKLLVS